MLVQSYLRQVADHDAFVSRTFMRDRRFAVAVLQSRRMAIDYGVIARAMAFRARSRRRQLAVLLDGRGYLSAHGRVQTLGPGDIVEADQGQLEAEGYGGDRCRVIIVDWEPGALFASAPLDAPRLSRIGAGASRRLARWIEQLEKLPPEGWVARLCRELVACGAAVEREVDPRTLTCAAPALETTYGALGDALSHLDAHPSSEDIARRLCVSERQLARRMRELALEYGHPFAGWRDLLHEMRFEWATQLLSIPRISPARVAALSGYRSTVALCHAFSGRGADSPGVVARRLAERWG